jgi:hypothetical protein
MPTNPFVNMIPIDNVAPQFTQVTYIAMLREDASIGHIITLNNLIEASDANLNDDLEYIILGGFDAPLFQLNDDNEIILIGNLDFETKQTLSFRIAVTDGSAWDTSWVDVYVVNVNEAPVITSDHSTAIILPDGYYDTVSQIAKVKATDVDVADTLIFNIIAGNDEDLFEIDANGVITMVANGKFLVYNAKPVHNLTIEVSDGNGGVANTTVTINVAEVNNAPEFVEQFPYYGTVREDASIGHIITLNNLIEASDANLNDDLEYIILGGFDAPLFQLNDDNEIILIGNLDFEAKQTLSLRIAVTDGSAWDAVSVDIYVKDVNEAPEFINEGPITILVAEDYSNDDGMPITTITAADPENGMLEYFINGDDDGLFTINDRGQITLSDGKSLDYDTATSHLFTVEVVDSESNSNKINVMINVDNVIEDIVLEPALSADII